MCGGVRVPMIRLVQELQQCVCVAPGCQYRDPKPLETLYHMYMQCAVGRGALRWLAGLWGLIDPGGAPVPECARVWLADDDSVWKPSPGLASLWALLRLTVLKCVWSVRCVARRGRGVYAVGGCGRIRAGDPGPHSAGLGYRGGGCAHQGGCTALMV